MKRMVSLLFLLLLVLGLGSAVYAETAPATKGIVVTNPAVSGVGVWTDKPEYMVGEAVKLSFRSDVEGYAVLFDGQGNTIWPQAGNNGFINAGRTYTVPSLTASEPLGATNVVLVVFKRASLSVWDLIPSLTLKPAAVQTDSKATATCTFNTIPKVRMATLRVTGPAGARIFLDGQDYGSLPLTMQVVVDRHQLVAIMPDMVAQVKTLTQNDGLNGFIDWQPVFTPIR